MIPTARKTFRVSKKWLPATFSILCENLKVFIRSDVHAVRAGISLKGCRPLTTPGLFDRLTLCPLVN